MHTLTFHIQLSSFTVLTPSLPKMTSNPFKYYKSSVSRVYYY